MKAIGNLGLKIVVSTKKEDGKQVHKRTRETTTVKLPTFSIENNNKIIEITGDNKVDKHKCVGCRSLTVLH
jgi:hypothetical protein